MWSPYNPICKALSNSNHILQSISHNGTGGKNAQRVLTSFLCPALFEIVGHVEGGEVVSLCQLPVLVVM